MAGTTKAESVEIKSDQLRSELVEIKERLGALETIAGLANRAEVEALARRVISDSRKKQIMSACASPKTRAELVEVLGFESTQALDYHLTTLKDGEMIHQGFTEKNKQNFGWSKLFSNLPKRTREAILAQ